MWKLCFWNQCERRYHMTPEVTFTLKVANYLPYFTQEYIENTCLSHHYKETDDWMPILILI